MSLNVCTLTGRLVKDVELKYTGQGTAVASFTLAVDRAFKNAQGEKETDFINEVARRKTAETLANYTGKGSLIGVTGRLQVRNYENKDGQRVYVTEVVADSFTFLESKKQAQGNTSSQGRVENIASDPFMTQATKSGTVIEIDDADMPF